jgi:phosphoserine phosphatase RsbU/P
MGCAPEQLPMTRAIAGAAVPEAYYQLRSAYASAPRDLAVSAQPILDEEGGLHGGVVVLRDVTEQLALQKKAASMALAGDVQARLFPSAPPPGLTLDLAGRVLPAEETSGDYYDWMLEPDGRLVLAIGDVSDHGLSSALMMMSARAYLRSQVDLGRSPDDVLARVNARLARELPPERFVTLLCVEVDPRTRSVRYANAGHPAGFVLGPDGSVEAELGATGPLLGVMEDSAYALREAPALLPGRVLVLLTDGAVECGDRHGRRFEQERLLEIVRRNRLRPAAGIVAAVGAALVEFAGSAALADDVTLVVLKG